MADDVKKGFDEIGESVSELSEVIAATERNIEAFSKRLRENAAALSDHGHTLSAHVDKIRGYHKEVEALNKTLERVVGNEEKWADISKSMQGGLRDGTSEVRKSAKAIEERNKKVEKANELEESWFKRQGRKAKSFLGMGASAIAGMSKGMFSRSAQAQTTQHVEISDEGDEQVVAKEASKGIASKIEAYRNLSKSQKEILNNINIMRDLSDEESAAKRQGIEREMASIEAAIVLEEKRLHGLESSTKILNKGTTAYIAQEREIQDVKRSLEGWSALLHEANEGIEEADFHLDKWGKSARWAVELTEGLSYMFQGAADSSEELAKALDKQKAMADTMIPGLHQIAVLKHRMRRRSKELEKASPRTARALRGVGAAIRAFSAAATAGLSVITGLAQTIGRLALSVVTFPFRLWEELNRQMNRATEIAERYATANQAVVAQFGSLRVGIGRAVIDMQRSLAGSSEFFSQLGVNLSNAAESIFGWDEDAQIKMQEAMAQLASDMGSLFFATRDMVEGSIPEMVAFQRGLGLTGEHLNALVRDAHAGGRDIVDDLNEINLASQSLASQFGLDSRGIAQDMAYMRQNFATFGQRTVQEMAQTALYTRRFGIEVAEILGLVNQFDDFEGAAQNAAMLAQAFGMNVDAMQLFNAEAPEERLDIIRREFLRTGRTFEDLNRREVRLMASTVGMSEEALRQIMRHGHTLEEVQEQAAEATLEGAIMSQAVAMQRLGDSIERLIQRQGRFSGVFDAFIQGVDATLIRSGPLQEFFGAMQGFMDGVHQFGRSFGNILANQLGPAFRMTSRFFDHLSGNSGLFDDLEESASKFFKNFGEHGALSDFIMNTVETIGRAVQDALSVAFEGMRGNRSVGDLIRWIGSEVRTLFGEIFNTPQEWLDGRTLSGAFMNSLRSAFMWLQDEIFIPMAEIFVDIIAIGIGNIIAEIPGLGRAGRRIKQKAETRMEERADEAEAARRRALPEHERQILDLNDEIMAVQGALAALRPVAAARGRAIRRMPREERALEQELARLNSRMSALRAEQFRNNEGVSEVGAGITEGIVMGMENEEESLTNSASYLTGRVQQDFEEASEQNSPSRLFAREVGEPISQGIAVGITSDASVRRINEAIRTMTGSMVRSANAGVVEDFRVHGNPVDLFVESLERRADDIEALAERVHDLFGLGRDITLEASVRDGRGEDSARVDLGDGLGLTINMNVTLDADDLAFALSQPGIDNQLQRRS